MEVTREKLTLTRQEALRILRKRDQDFEVIEDEIVDTSRWSIVYSLVVKRKSDGKFFSDSYRVGATECQEESPWDSDEPSFTEVFPLRKP